MYKVILGEEGGDLYSIILSCLDDMCYNIQEM